MQPTRLKTYPRVYAVVVNWNGLARTASCLRALAATHCASLTTVVVDNGSTDGSSASIKASHPKASVIALERNIGFSGGANAGIRRAIEDDADYVWLLNNDADPEPDALAIMVEQAESDQRLGAVGAVVVETNGKTCRTTYGGGRVNRWLGLAHHNTSPPSEQRLDYLMGACMLVRVAALREVGLLDEDFFLYWEDTDLCFRMRARGWKLAVARDARVRHEGNASLGQGSSRFDYHFFASARRFFRKHAPLPLLPITIAPALWSLRHLARGDLGRAKATCRGAWRLGSVRNLLPES